MNRKQGFDFLFPIIKHYKNKKNLLWLFAGEGPAKKELIYKTRKIRNIRFLPLQNSKNISEWLNTGDIHIIPQNETVQDLVFPSKLLGILASGNPIVSNASSKSDLGEIVSKTGIRVNPYDQKGFIKALDCLVNDDNLRSSLGRKARKHASENYEKNFILERFEYVLSNTLNKIIF